jgi:NAD(P)-dependent dehydrogenase (short-subunit alcohol dehydrogenase family)
LDILSESAPSRIVNVTSEAHIQGTIDYELFRGKHPFSAWKSYSSSKLALTGITREMAERFEKNGVSVFSVHPGFVPGSFLFRTSPPLLRLLFRFLGLFAKSPKQGAATSVYAAVSPELEGKSGAYLKHERIADPPPAVEDKEMRSTLWNFLMSLI